MALGNPNVVDYLCVEPGNEIVVVLLDELDWSDEQNHLALLQEKINRYIAFVESGEFRTAVRERIGPEAPTSGSPRIRVIARFEPSEEGKKLLQHVHVGSSRVDLQACKLEYSIVSPK